MLETLDKCPVCQNSETKQYLEVTDFTVSKEKFKIVRCESCSFLYTNPRPDAATIGPYYHSENYISHHNEKTNLLSFVYNNIRKYAVEQKLNLITSHTDKRKPKLLDYGCGTGYFLSACARRGWGIAGIEPDKDAASKASSLLKIPVSENLTELNLTRESFDVITLWHVLEHVHELNETLSKLRTLLRPDGIMIIAVPNPESEDAAQYREFWAAFDVPRHLYHFSKNTLTELLHKHQLKVDKIEPMKFDAFYVSLLSTKYKYGRHKYPESVVAGLRSNTAGLTNRKYPNTSSLIYIASKLPE